MKTSELLRKLKEKGCRFIEHRRNHDLWFSPITGKQFIIPRHPSQEMAPGTANGILKDAGVK